MAPSEVQSPHMSTIQSKLSGYLKKRISIISKAENRFDGILEEVDGTADHPVARLRQVRFCGSETRRDHVDNICGETFQALNLKLPEIKDAFAHIETCPEMRADSSIIECTAAVVPILWFVERSGAQVKEPTVFPLDNECQPDTQAPIDTAAAAEFLSLFMQAKNLISFVSKSQIRYEGIIHAVDVTSGSVSLTSVCMKGTEDRPCERFVPEREEMYPAVKFTLSEIRDIKVFLPMSDELRRDPILENSNVTEPSVPYAHRSNNLGYLNFSIKILEAIRANEEAKQHERIVQSHKLSTRSSQAHMTMNGTRLSLQVGDLHQSPRNMRIPLPGDFLIQRTKSGSTDRLISSRLDRAENGQFTDGDQTVSNQVTPETQSVDSRKRKRSQSKKVQEQSSLEVTPVNGGVRVPAKRGRKPKIVAETSSEEQVPVRSVNITGRRSEMGSRKKAVSKSNDRRRSKPEQNSTEMLVDNSGPENDEEGSFHGSAQNTATQVLQIELAEGDHNRLQRCPIEGCDDPMKRRNVHQVESHLKNYHGQSHPGLSVILKCSVCSETGFANSMPTLKRHMNQVHGIIALDTHEEPDVFEPNDVNLDGGLELTDSGSGVAEM